MSAKELAERMDEWPLALAAIEAGTDVLYANKRGRERLLKSGAVKFGPLGQLRLPSDTPLAEALADSQSGVRLQNLKSGIATNVQLFVSALSDIAVMIIDNDAQPHQRTETFIAEHRLSVAEGELVVGLVAGKSLTEIAANRNTSRDTVRTQLQAIFRKTGTHRQAELLRLYQT